MQSALYVSALTLRAKPLSEQLNALADEALYLERNGHQVIGAAAGRDSLVIELAPSRRLEFAANTGNAVSIARGRDEDGEWERFALRRRPIVVFWNQRKEPTC